MKTARYLAPGALLLLPLLSLSLVRCSSSPASGGEDSGTETPDGGPPLTIDTGILGEPDGTAPADAGDATVLSDAGSGGDALPPADAGSKASDAGGGGSSDAALDASAADASDAARAEDTGAGSADAATDATAPDAASSSDSGASDAQVDGAPDAGCSAPSETCPGVLLLGTSSSSILAGSFASGAWTKSSLSDTSTSPPALTVDASGRVIGVYTSGTGSVVGYTIYAGGAWSAPAAIASSAVARLAPAIDATGSSTAYAVYQDTSYKYWSLALSGSAWSSPLSVGSTSQDYGPVPASVASLGASATIGFIDGQSPNLNWVAEADLVSGSWGSTTDVAGPESFTVSPSLVPLTSGPELMMVFVASSGSQIQYVTRTSGSWSPPASIANASTGNTVALAPLPSGGAILAFRGSDGNLYWSQYAGSAWSNVAAFSSPNVAISGSPAVVHGVNGDTAEIAYVGTDGTAYAAHLASGTWSSPTQVGGSSLNGIAIASVP